MALLQLICDKLTFNDWSGY